jgi:hypothetical protein
MEPGICGLIDRNEIHLGWAAELIIERNLPLVTPNKPQKNRINRPRRLSYNWWKPNVYGHRCIGHDVMPQHIVCMWCQFGNETYSHFFLDCPRFNASRRRLLDRLSITLEGSELFLPRLSKNTIVSILTHGIEGNYALSTTIFNLVHEYISETKRFN